MYYLSLEHENNFNTLMDKYNKKEEPNYTVAFYVLSVPEIYTRAEKHISDEEINFIDLYNKEMLDDDYKYLILVAGNLFNTSFTFNLNLYINLEEKNYKVFIQALDIMRD